MNDEAESPMTEEAQREQFLDALRSRELIGPDVATQEESDPSRGYFAAIEAIAGICAAAFFCVAGFVFVADFTVGRFGLGAFWLAIAYYIYRNHPSFAPTGHAMSIAGQLLLVSVFAELLDGASMIAFAVLAMQAVLLVLFENRFARVSAAFFGVIAWALVVRFGWWDSGVEDGGLVAELLGWFVIWLPVLFGTHSLIRTERLWLFTPRRPVARAATIGFILALALGTWVSNPSWLLASPGKDWLALWPVLGAAASLSAAIFAFRLRGDTLVIAAVIGVIAHVSHFYYQLGTTLLFKSGLMLLVGASMLAAAKLLGDTEATARVAPTPRTVRNRNAWAILAAGLLVAVALNVSIYKKEKTIRTGETIFLELQPVDPRSIMQGDYMALQFTISRDLGALNEKEDGNHLAPLAVDERGVATVGDPSEERHIRYAIRSHRRGSQPWIGTNAYFFEEGSAERFEAARYGEFRLNRDTGEAILVGMRDADLQAIK